MEAPHPSETLGYIYQSLWRNVEEDLNLHHITILQVSHFLDCLTIKIKQQFS